MAWTACGPLRAKWGERLRWYDAQRHEKNIFLVEEKGVSNYQKGEDVLLDTLLLAETDFLLKSASAVSEYAVYFNPLLHDRSVDLQWKCGHNQTSLEWMVGTTGCIEVPPAK